ncbi:F-box domain containing protein, partial [Parasponia andersonii]
QNKINICAIIINLFRIPKIRTDQSFGFGWRKAKRPSSSSSSSSYSMSESGASKFFSVVSDDILLEVFLLLPHRRYLIQCSTVCKRWFSLISHAEFNRRFIEYHERKRSSDRSYSLPYTLLLRASPNTHRPPICDILSKKSKSIHGQQSPSVGVYSHILPQNGIIRASVEDLVLLSRYPNKYCIYNPLTRQGLWLPVAPRGYCFKCGFVCEPNSSGYTSTNITDQYRFRVLHIAGFSNNWNNWNDYVFDGELFCSETGKWSKLVFSFPQRLAPNLKFVADFIASRGILYSLVEGVDDNQICVKGIVALDLSMDDTSEEDRNRCRFIHLPADFGRGWRARRGKVCFGMVRGQLRLSQLVKIVEEAVLKVWELDCNNNNDADWVLVHHARLKCTEETNTSVAAFHPYNGDVVFMLRDEEIYKFEIGEEKYKKVGEFRGLGLYCTKEKLPGSLRAFTLVYPSWPTPISKIP